VDSRVCAYVAFSTQIVHKITSSIVVPYTEHTVCGPTLVE